MALETSNHQVVYGVTYSPNVLALVARAKELIAQDSWSQYIRTPYLDPLTGQEADGVADQIELYMTKVHTAYGAGGASLCLIKMRLRDLAGDPLQPDYISFVEDLGMTLLAAGTNRGPQCCYTQIETGVGNQYLHPQAKELYETVLPPTQLEDEEGNPLGEPYFTRWIEFERAYLEGRDPLL